MMDNLMKSLPTAVSILTTLVIFLWWISTKFNSLEIEQSHLKIQAQQSKVAIMKIKKQIEPIPLHSQMILNEKSELNQFRMELDAVSLKIGNINKILRNYVDKDYFYRDMGIIKNDFRTTNAKVYLNSQKINYVEGKLNVGYSQPN